MIKTLLRLEGLSIGYSPNNVIASNINTSLNIGDLICLIGPNGVGKSTLLRTLAGMQKPLAGRVLLMEEDIHQLPAKTLARQLSVVLTDRVEVGLLTGYGLVALGRYPHTNWLGRLSSHDLAVIRWAVELVEATHLAQRPISELSDGERQKLMIARALAQEPTLMILDEPTAYLDLPRRVEILQLLRRLAHVTGRTILASTHDLDLAMRLADVIWLFAPNGLLFVGAPEELVLNGVFERVFRKEGITFDPHTGSFDVSGELKDTISLKGEGLYAFWTRRALERRGFAIANVSPTTVEVWNEDGQTRWRLSRSRFVADFDSISALLSAIADENIS